MGKGGGRRGKRAQASIPARAAALAARKAKKEAQGECVSGLTERKEVLYSYKRSCSKCMCFCVQALMLVELLVVLLLGLLQAPASRVYKVVCVRVRT